MIVLGVVAGVSSVGQLVGLVLNAQWVAAVRGAIVFDAAAGPPPIGWNYGSSLLSWSPLGVLLSGVVVAVAWLAVRPLGLLGLASAVFVAVGVAGGWQLRRSGFEASGLDGVDTAYWATGMVDVLVLLSAAGLVAAALRSWGRSFATAPTDGNPPH
ncbi:hypothetical protein RDV89_09840 [Nocardioides zeae]|uniref:Uncharacterized protein n=1 Tax=Nocardioides imazamoxiresistens TaxID=3231893 RepID=A0ABU3PVW4_9ACTN|nr:hypothetical protein [Nocardioides zeae]MDT9593368.1 hypothetical protein [Nocardioides zeae]